MTDQHEAAGSVPSDDESLRFESHIAWLQLILAVVVGGGFLFYCLGLPYLSDRPPSGFETLVAACIAPLALAAAGFRRSVAIDRARGEVARRTGWFFLQRTKRFALAAYDRVEVRSSTVQHDTHVARSKQRLSAESTSYPVILAGPGGAELTLTTSASYESSLEEAARIARALGLSLQSPSSNA